MKWRGRAESNRRDPAVLTGLTSKYLVPVLPVFPGCQLAGAVAG